MKLKRRQTDVVLITCGIIFSIFTISCPPPPPLLENNTPVADAGSDLNGTVDQPITFDGSGSYDPDGDPLTFTWDYGDDVSDVDVGPTTTHTYTEAGTYIVTLTVSDEVNQPVSASTTAVVGADECENINFTEPADGASFNQGNPVTFRLEDSSEIIQSVTWHSSIDNVFGNENPITVNDLSFGTHIISATVVIGATDVCIYSKHIIISESSCVPTGGSGCTNDSDCCAFPAANCDFGDCESCVRIGSPCQFDMDCCDYPNAYCDFIDEVCKVI
jgi:hypothetical protein